MSDVRALYLHGVGQQAKGYSFHARRNLRDALRAQGRGFWPRELVWSHVMDGDEGSFLASAKEQGSDGNPLQRLVIGTLTDALAWQSTPAYQAQVFAMLDEEFALLHTPPTVFAHSLGVLIMTDYLRARPNAQIAALYSMGDNVGLFNQGKLFDCPAQLKPTGVWTNLWSPSDMLGYPAKAQAGFEQVIDIKVRVGSWLTCWTGLSHCFYWDSDRLWSKTIPRLMKE